MTVACITFDYVLSKTNVLKEIETFYYADDDGVQYIIRRSDYEYYNDFFRSVKDYIKRVHEGNPKVKLISYDKREVYLLSNICKEMDINLSCPIISVHKVIFNNNVDDVIPIEIFTRYISGDDISDNKSANVMDVYLATSRTSDRLYSKYSVVAVDALTKYCAKSPFVHYFNSKVGIEKRVYLSTNKVDTVNNKGMVTVQLRYNKLCCLDNVEEEVACNMRNLIIQYTGILPESSTRIKVKERLLSAIGNKEVATCIFYYVQSIYIRHRIKDGFFKAFFDAVNDVLKKNDLEFTDELKEIILDEVSTALNYTRKTDVYDEFKEMLSMQ